ncbi:Intracellular distribution of mitochondria [Entomophthora muscae]|uniref:Intracellular distribution of mitochondria n=1 Tax=Entomophthora muscae TaxID=34485 RepID=A0ACC2T3P7_9FUNG|nr:Intracellular distribution of mitochondria [Entomophthora muscae]
MSVDQIVAPASAVEKQPPAQDVEKVSTEVAQQEAPEEESQQIEILEVEVALPHEPYKIKVPVALTETLQDIRQSIIENPFTYFYSCFYLEHEGVRLNDYHELAAIADFKEKPQLKLKEDVYSERESRIHILRLRELLKGYHQPCGRYGYDEGLSVFHAIAPSSTASKKKKKKAEKSPETVTTTSFEEYNFEETLASLRNYSPADSIVTPPKCLRLMTLSGWNPVTPARKLAGDLLYLTVTTVENKVFEITSSASGYFVNNSTSETFDPSRKAPIHNMQAHSLIHLLQYLSPGFRTNISKIQQALLASDMLQLIQAPTCQISHPWIVTPRTPAHDACRPCEAFLATGSNADESLHDWNEELQSQRELPRTTLQERILRDRMLNKLYVDFFDACAQAAYGVAEGNIPALNPNEPEDSHMFVHNNLFISKTFDGLNQFDKYGGEEAAYVAASKDIIGVRLLNQLDLEGLYTMGSCLVDYRGERYVVQCVIPGLFRMQELIQYGTTDLGVTIFADEKFQELTAKLVDALHLSPHEVKDGNGKTFTLNTSLDVKGICGAEGRHYLVDLHRLNPVDIVFQEAECIEREGFKAYPHKMTLLRRETGGDLLCLQAQSLAGPETRVRWSSGR